MKFNEIDKGIDLISMPEHNEIYNESNEIIPNISQHKLINTIHQEFQRSFISRLYFNSYWTDRIFWNVVGTLQQKYYDELSLDQITTAIKQYLNEHKMIIPIELSHRDQAKLIHDIIRALQQDHEGKAPTDKVLSHASKAGIDESKADDVIRKLKREGAIFEPRAGHLKSTYR